MVSKKKKILSSLCVGAFVLGMVAPVMDIVPDAAQSYAAAAVAAKPQSSGVPKLVENTLAQSQKKAGWGHISWDNVTTSKTRKLTVHSSSEYTESGSRFADFIGIKITNSGNYDIQIEIPNPTAKNFSGGASKSVGKSGPKWTPMAAKTITLKPKQWQSFDLAPGGRDGVINIKQVGGKVSHASIRITSLSSSKGGRASLSPMN